MIEKLEIENYRGIAHGEISGLAPLTILVGPNSSGKSSILEALFLAASTGSGDALALAATRRGWVGGATTLAMLPKGNAPAARKVALLTADVEEASLCSGGRDSQPGNALKIRNVPSDEVAILHHQDIGFQEATHQAGFRWDRSRSSHSPRASRSSVTPSTLFFIVPSRLITLSQSGLREAVSITVIKARPFTGSFSGSRGMIRPWSISASIVKYAISPQPTTTGASLKQGVTENWHCPNPGSDSTC